MLGSWAFYRNRFNL